MLPFDCPKVRINAIFAGILLGTFLIIPTMFLAWLSIGNGHGSYSLCKIFFPYPMLLTMVQGNEITCSVFCLALAQSPLYGGIIGMFAKDFEHTLKILAAICVLHGIGVVACFALSLYGFN